MRDTKQITETMKKLKAYGYKIIVRIMAPSEHDSVIGIFLRYEQEKARTGSGRWSDLQVHNRAYVGVPITVDRIEKGQLADRIQIYNRKREILYDNSLIDGKWKLPLLGKKTIFAERNRCPTTEEVHQHQDDWMKIVRMMLDRGAYDNLIEQVQSTANIYRENLTRYSSYSDEISRRIGDIPSLRRLHGVCYIFWRIAATMVILRKRDNVNWYSVDLRVVKESAKIYNGMKIANALCEHSPGAVSLAGKALVLDDSAGVAKGSSTLNNTLCLNVYYIQYKIVLVGKQNVPITLLNWLAKANGGHSCFFNQI